MKGVKHNEQHEHKTIQGERKNNNKTHKTHETILLALGCRYCKGYTNIILTPTFFDKVRSLTLSNICDIHDIWVFGISGVFEHTPQPTT